MLRRRTLLAATIAVPFIPGFAAAGELPLDDTTARGFVRSAVIRWGDRVEPDSPAFVPGAVDGEAAEKQFAWDAIVVGVLPQVLGDDGVPRALMVVAHPSPIAAMLPPSAHSKEALRGMEGASILNLERHDGRWLVADGGFQTRRLTPATLCRVGGPLQAQLGEGVRGPVGPLSGCVTPWGHALIAETPSGIAAGYVVDLDPADPDAIPVKRTALGRFARAGMAVTQTSDGRPVVLMSEAGGQGRLFRFVARAPISADAPDALDDGELSVGVLRGLTLEFVRVSGDPLQAGGTNFDSPAGMLVLTDGSVLITCRGGVGNGVQSELGQGNPDGCILLLRPQGDRQMPDSYAIELALAGGDTGFGNAVVSRPSELAMGGRGEVWIGAEGTGIALAEERFTKITQAYLQPRGAVIGGIAKSSDGSEMFAAVRHPGATSGSSWANPVTRWPTLRSDMPPQTMVVALRRG